MSDSLNQRNAEAARQQLEDHEKRMVDLEKRVNTLVNEIMTVRNHMQQLQQSNTLALQKLVGTGATANGDDN